MRTEPLPILLLAGFLGSGKTSTLRNWLEKTKMPLKRVAVVINDFGEINVDAALLAKRQLELTQITGGCVCCQSMEELQQQLVTLANNPELDLVWVETSGLADPEEVLDHLSSPQLTQVAHVRRLILVVDASDYPCSWRGRAVQEEQIKYADLILLNKVDRISKDVLEKLVFTLEVLNPMAEIIPAQFGVISADLLSDKADEHTHEPHDHEHVHECGCGHEHAQDDHEHSHGAHSHADHDHAHDDHSHEHGHNHDGHAHDHHHHNHLDTLHASTLFLPLPKALARGQLETFLQALPPAVFRAKGFVRLKENLATLFTVQKVRDQSELLLLPLESDTAVTPLQSGLILIGPHLPHAEIEALAARILV